MSEKIHIRLSFLLRIEYIQYFIVLIFISMKIKITYFMIHIHFLLMGDGLQIANHCFMTINYNGLTLITSMEVVVGDWMFHFEM